MHYKGFKFEEWKEEGYTLFFEGDELYFETEDEAIEFIDSLEEEEDNEDDVKPAWSEEYLNYLGMSMRDFY